MIDELRSAWKVGKLKRRIRWRNFKHNTRTRYQKRKYQFLLWIHTAMFRTGIWLQVRAERWVEANVRDPYYLSQFHTMPVLRDRYNGETIDDRYS